MAVKKGSSIRFKIHDEDTAPAAAVPLLKVATGPDGHVPNFLGTLASSPAALRTYLRALSEFKKGVLSDSTRERLALAVHEYYDSKTGIAIHTRAAQQSGIGLDEALLARSFDSRSKRQAVLLEFVHELLDKKGKISEKVYEHTLEENWSEEELLESIAYVSLESFVALVNVVGDVPVDRCFSKDSYLKAA